MPDSSHTPLLGLDSSVRPFLLYHLGRAIYGIDVRNVGEIVSLPELNPVAERGGHFVGVVNLRGTILPVMDLQFRLGGQHGEYGIHDHLLVLQHESEQLAIIVNQVLGVERLTEDQLDSFSARVPADQQQSTFIEHVARIEGQIAMLLNVEKLISTSIASDSALPDAAPLSFFETASPEDQSEFRDRAQRLMPPIAGEQGELLALAIIEIAGEFFGLDFECVREFFESRKVTPVPCCPPHIIGNVNLRGDIVTLIDVRRRLNLPPVRIGSGGKVVVVCNEELVAGILVDDLHDVVYLRSSEILPVPDGIRAAGDHIRGTAPFQDRMMTILDLPNLMKLEEWVVDEEVAGRV